VTFPQLQYLLEIHRAGSITQAAKNLFVAQSSVSVALGAIETELGFPVFVRSRKGLIPTPQGAEAIAHAKRIVESYRLMTTPSEEHRTNLRISSNSMEPAQNAFIRLVQENHHRNDLTLEMLSSVGDAMEKLRFFDLELPLTMVVTPLYMSQEKKMQSKGMEVRRLGQIPAAIQIGQRHPLYHTETVSAKNFAEDHFLEMPGKTISYALLKSGIMRIREDRIIISSQSSVRRRLLQEGLVFTVGHMLPNQPEYKDDVRYIPLEGLSYTFCAVTNPLHPPIPELDRYMELLQEELLIAGIQAE